MGFGSYDESEQENQEIDTDLDDEAVTTGSGEDGEIRFEYGDASSEDLLDRFEEIKEQ
ncbi:MAG: DUF5786 family protein [Natronomonas sp.]